MNIRTRLYIEDLDSVAGNGSERRAGEKGWDRPGRYVMTAKDRRRIKNWLTILTFCFLAWVIVIEVAFR